MGRYLNKLYIVYALIICLISASLMPIVASASATSNKALLCTSQGYQWVIIDTQGPPEQQVRHCVVCFLSDQSDDILADSNNCLQSAYPKLAYLDPAPYQLASQVFKPSAHPRAPPIHILSW